MVANNAFCQPLYANVKMGVNATIALHSPVEGVKTELSGWKIF
jgi:hypothetical protein